MAGRETSPAPLHTAFATDSVELGRFSMIATDVDGTLTTAGELTSAVVDAIRALGDAGIEVVPISGRPAGEVLGLARYLPGVRRAVAENGLLEIVPDRAPRWLGAPTDADRLRAVGEHLNKDHGAGLRLAGDAFCRMGDVAYERDGRDVPELERLREVARGQGVHLVWSNVHVHLAEAIPDKGAGLMTLLAEWDVDPSSVITIGDAPNDAGLFVEGRFGMTVGTADVLEQLDVFPHMPQFVAASREGTAFLELAAGLLAR